MFTCSCTDKAQRSERKRAGDADIREIASQAIDAKQSVGTTYRIAESAPRTCMRAGACHVSHRVCVRACAADVVHGSQSRVKRARAASDEILGPTCCTVADMQQ